MSRSGWMCANPSCRQEGRRTMLGEVLSGTLWIPIGSKVRRDGNGLTVICPACGTPRTYWGRVAMLIVDDRKSA